MHKDDQRRRHDNAAAAAAVDSKKSKAGKKRQKSQIEPSAFGAFRCCSAVDRIFHDVNISMHAAKYH
jgi:hypothetical protein